MPDRTDAVLRHLRGLARPPDREPDADLLGRFVADRDPEAFAGLVRRHGPMVFSVCRRVLGCAHDADDAFQATFLVLARRAGAVRPRSLLANWLYGVAYRTALEARRAAAVRRAREQRAAGMRDITVLPDGPEPDLREVLDRELAALPDVYRAAVVVCDLEGLSRRDAAARLGWTEGAVAGRLARGRAVLARRLAGYGLAVPAGVLAAPECLAAGLVESTARLGVLVAAGEAVVAAPVAALTEGVMKAMLVTKLKTMTAAVMVGCAVLVTAAAGWQAEAATQDRPATKAADTPKKAGRNADKDRIAELERERERLLKRVAQLEDRLAAVEDERAKERARAEEARKAAYDVTGLGTRIGTPAPVTDPVPTTPAVGLSPPTTPVPASGGLPTTAPPASTIPPAPTLNPPPADRPASVTPPGTPPRPSTPTSRPAPLREDNIPPEARPDPRAVRPTLPSGPLTTDELPARGSGLVTKVYPVDGLADDDKQAEALIRLVRRAAGAGTWDTDGGAGVVEFFQQGKALVVRNTPDAHKELGELLGLLKELTKMKTRQPTRP